MRFDPNRPFDPPLLPPDVDFRHVQFVDLMLKARTELGELNGYIESFNGKLRDELLNREIFDTLQEARVLAERSRWEYNTVRPHSSLDYRPPAPEAVLRLQTASA